MIRLLTLTIALLGLLGLCAPSAMAAPSSGPKSVDSAPQLRAGASRDAAIVFGNEAYAALPQATYAAQDARAFNTFLVDGIGVSKYRIRYHQNATTATMLDAIRRTATRVKRGGTLWVYYSGHGYTVGDKGARVLLGVDATPDSIDKKSVSLDYIIASARKSQAANIVFIIDAGFGGAGRDGIELIPGQSFELTGPYKTEDNRVVMWLADDASRTARDYPASRHGLFSWLVMGGLRGWADGIVTGARDGKVTLEEVQRYAIWTGRQLGRPIWSSEDRRPDKRALVLSEGVSMEVGPTAEELRELAIADRMARISELEDNLKAEAAAFWSQTVDLARKGGPEGEQALQAFIDEYDLPIITIQWAVFIPEVVEARRALENYGTVGAEPMEVVSTESCDDLVAAEASALLGQLADGQIACLQNRIRTARLQTTKNKLSRLLLVDAEAKGDVEAWEAIMARHLEDIDRSDPDLCLRYAIHLFKKGADFLEDAVYWADYALENKQVWVGDEYVKRVNSLLRLRAEAAAKLWSGAEQRYRAEASDENDAMTREYRGLAKDFSREWLDYARASGQSTQAAFELCRSAAGTEDACKSR